MPRREISRRGFSHSSRTWYGGFIIQRVPVWGVLKFDMYNIYKTAVTEKAQKPCKIWKKVLYYTHEYLCD